MRNFEADKLVRVGDVIDFLEHYTQYDDDQHEIETDDYEIGYVTCDLGINLDDIAIALLEKAVEDAHRT